MTVEPYIYYDIFSFFFRVACPASEVSIPQWFLMDVGGPGSVVSIMQYLQKGGRMVEFLWAQLAFCKGSLRFCMHPSCNSL